MRIVGIETEYGVADPANAGANPIALSSDLVAACRAWAAPAAVAWDYGGEDPLQDQRGGRVDRTTALPEQLTDAPGFDRAAGRVTLRRRRGSWEDPAHLNAVLGNGARFYVDHAHPEFSGPEVATASDAVLWDRAGDQIAVAAAAEYERVTGERIDLYKNNVDGKGASYGCHENYLVPRQVDFHQLATRLTAHLVTRQIVVGSGRVGLGVMGETPGFQIAQRADYMEAEMGLETTLRRPIVNTRDEPHAERSRWRRLHVIIGDANCLQVPTYLKIGATSLVLSAIEADDDRLDALVLADPVAAVAMVSRDLNLDAPLTLASGERATALEVQRALVEICRDHVTDSDEAQVLARWNQVLETLARDPMVAARDVEWVAKLRLLARLRDKHSSVVDEVLTPLSWDAPMLAAVDLQWSRLGDGWAAKLEQAGEVTVLHPVAQVEQAMRQPPAGSRAAVRGRIVSARPDLVDAAGWASVVLDHGGDHLEVVHLDDPYADRHPLLDALAAQPNRAP